MGLLLEYNLSLRNNEEVKEKDDAMVLLVK